MNISEKLRVIAQTSADGVALVESNAIGSRSISFGDLECSVEKIASYLRKSGIRVGDAVLILHPMSIELYQFMIALFRVGAVAVFIDPNFGPRHVRRALAMCRPVASFTSTKAFLWQLVNKELSRIRFRITPHSIALALSEIEPTQFPDEIAQADSDSPALITFTSGSSGSPKAIVRTHEFLDNQLKSIVHTLQLKAGQCDLTTLPIFVLANIATGVTTVIPHGGTIDPTRMNPQAVAKQISRYRIDRLSASPSFMEKLCTISDLKCLQSITQIYMGGGPVFPDLLKTTKTAVPGARITAVYGSTECEPIGSICIDDISEEDWIKMEQGGGLLAGFIADGTSVLLREDSGTLSQGTSNQIGEILVTGESTVKTYLKGIGNSETKLEIDGTVWHRTGDAGYFDDKKRLWLVGRCAGAIADIQGTIYPFQVESAIRSRHPGTRTACISLRKKRLLVLEHESRFSSTSGNKSSSFRKDLMEELHWAGISEVVCVNKLPLDARHGAKIDYPALRKMFQARQGVLV